MDPREAHARNTAAMWLSPGPRHCRRLDSPGHATVLHLPRWGSTRVVLTRPGLARPRRRPPAFLREVPEGPLTVEDTFGTFSLASGRAEKVTRLAVMRRGAAAQPPPAPGHRAEAVAGAAALEQAERLITAAMPLPKLAPLLPGALLPPAVLEHPGWRVWLARREGEPAAAACTFDDGAAVGVYWVATLPAHRGFGLARAVLTAALAAHPGRAATLAATEAGRPLYASLGFEAVCTAAWHRWSHWPSPA